MAWQWFHQLGSPKWFYDKTGPWLPWIGCSAILLFAIGIVWGMGYAPAERLQGNSYRIMYVHFPASAVSLGGYYVMAIAGAVGLIWRIKMGFMVMKSAAMIGAVMTFLSLATGSIWAKPTWGAYWVWDARILFMLILLLLYIGIILLMETYRNQDSADFMVAILALVGTVLVPVIYKSVDWWYSLHQTASIKLTGKSAIDASMARPLIFTITSAYVAYAWFVIYNARTEVLFRERKTKWVKDLLAKG